MQRGQTVKFTGAIAAKHGFPDFLVGGVQVQTVPGEGRAARHQIALTLVARSLPFRPISSTNSTTMSTTGSVPGAIADLWKKMSELLSD
jgi:hypothetical protein